MVSSSSENKKRALHTLESIEETIVQLIEWNKNIESAEYFYSTQGGMQLMAANCTLVTAIGEGVNRVNRVMPDFLKVNYPQIPWHAIVGMRNHIAHGYFELDAELIYEAVKHDIPPLLAIIADAIQECKK